LNGLENLNGFDDFDDFDGFNGFDNRARGTDRLSSSLSGNLLKIAAEI
jgi:hypothetical protein